MGSDLYVRRRCRGEGGGGLLEARQQQPRADAAAALISRVIGRWRGGFIRARLQSCLIFNAAFFTVKQV